MDTESKFQRTLRDLHFSHPSLNTFYANSYPSNNLIEGKWPVYINTKNLSPLQIMAIIGHMPMETILDIDHQTTSILCKIYTPDIVTHLCLPTRTQKSQPPISNNLPLINGTEDPIQLYHQGLAIAHIITKGLPNSVATRIGHQLGLNVTNQGTTTDEPKKGFIRIPTETRATIQNIDKLAKPVLQPNQHLLH